MDYPSDVDEILHKKRKARDFKACYPCRQRKVKCDNRVPCRACKERNHPMLCQLHAPTKRPSSAVDGKSGDPKRARSTVSPSAAGDSRERGDLVSMPREDWNWLFSRLNTIEGSLFALKEDMARMAGTYEPSARPRSAQPTTTAPRQPDAEGIHAFNNLTGASVHLGGSSVPALVMNLSKSAHKAEVEELLSGGLLPMLGLDNESATYPFVDLWSGSGHIPGAAELCKALPTDTECLEFFHLYRDVAFTFYPAVADINAFELELETFLKNRADARAHTDGLIPLDESNGTSVSWIALLFALLASGSQCSNLSRRERVLTSQVYVCCSFQALRLTNFFQQPSLESVQALLVLGNVISNNMNPGVSWTLLGMTIRLAQSLGLHKANKTSFPSNIQLLRRKIWWAVVWQDSLLSLSYDRDSSTATMNGDVGLTATSSFGHRTYTESMYRVCKVTLDIVRGRMLSPGHNLGFSQISSFRKELEDIINDADDMLKDPAKCQTVSDQTEHYSLNLHISYLVSELCRPALGHAAGDDREIRELRKTCLENLVTTVKAFLGINKISSIGVRSWAALHRALSASLLLGIVEEPLRNPEIRALLSEMIAVLSALVSQPDESDPSNPTAGAPHGYGPLFRSLAALRKLNREEGVSPSALSSSSGGTKGPVSESHERNENGIVKSTHSPHWPSPLMAMTTSSPYSLMDSIIWGEATANGINDFVG
ncbi:MAG: hypothetical protein M1819_003859 [Sarea resinae]|nr:MAG: hypothetical protein M1819_003859 [Sarea resinae]